MPRSLEKNSPCKVNLLLNILGRRPDGFHELETVMHPVAIYDRLAFTRTGAAVELTCTDASLPTDGQNLVHRAATAFLEAARIAEGVRIHLEKKIPLAAGLGGGSGNAAITLLGLNELFDRPLAPEQLSGLAAALGSDVPFFLQNQPAVATGRGEKIIACQPFPAMQGTAFLLIYPGFGISTAWAYQNLARFPEALNGKPGRAQRLVKLLETGSLATAQAEFYNSLEAPALEKFPLLAIFQEYLRNEDASATLMSGSGSTTFALAASRIAAEELAEKVKTKFGAACWTAVAAV
jgi:4-diphosphocytidyl-2-C-methyl-D-erythritol kinase